MKLIGIFTDLIVIYGYVFIVSAQQEIVLPVKHEYAFNDNTCKHVLRTGALAALHQPIGTTDQLIVPYQPQCRVDRPDLFEARQCSQHDCFCVNVTTGAVLLGTLASPSEVGDCSTALYALLLAVKHPTNQLDDVSTYEASEDTTEKKIQISLETILSSAPGFQRVVNVTQLISLDPDQDHQVAHGGGEGRLPRGLAYYRVYLTSTGHLTLRAPLELLQHRLHEGYLPGVGGIDPKVSRLEMVSPRLGDPGILTRTEPTSIQIRLEKVKYEKPEVSQSKIVKKEDIPDESRSHKAMALRSSSADAQASFVPQAGGKVDRVSRLLAPSDDGDSITYRELTGAVSVKHSPEDNSEGILYQTWSARISWWNRVKQPGVLAGIVGSFVVVLLLLILLILFCVYRLRKRDEGSYALDEPHKLPVANCSYTRAPTREFYA